MYLDLNTSYKRKMNFTDILINEKQRLDRLIERLESEVSKEGSGYMIRIRRNGSEYYYRKEYVDGKRVSHYLGVKGSEPVQQNMINRFNRERLKIMKYDRDVLADALQDYVSFDMQEIRAGLPAAYKDMPLDKITDVISEELQKWTNEDYERNKKPFTVTHIACDGTPVRSKGECIWYNCLKSLGVPFRYENETVMETSPGSAVNRYPDFTIKCADGETILIEHLGMMKDNEYRELMQQRIILYYRNGYVLGDNLYITCDNQYGEINSMRIYKIAQDLILPRALP
ncbi:MAG: hypothetical protein LKJ83_08905 [Eubacteriaceae bacterium]|nr:hypothetical protein [Eubacteriaceae bacterium]